MISLSTRRLHGGRPVRAGPRRTGIHRVRAGALSEPQHHAGTAVRRRQRHRHHDAPDLERTRHSAGREHGDRQQGGRQWLDCRELCRPLGAGRLHAVRDDEHHAFGKSVSAEDHELRPDQGLHADRAHRRPALHAGDPSRHSRELGRRTDRAGQEGARQVVLCQRQFIGDRLGRDVRPPRRHRSAARSLQEFAAGPDRRDRRPRLHDVRRRPDRPAPRQRQSAQGACGHDQTAARPCCPIFPPWTLP